MEEQQLGRAPLLFAPLLLGGSGADAHQGKGAKA